MLVALDWFRSNTVIDEAIANYINGRKACLYIRPDDTFGSSGFGLIVFSVPEEDLSYLILKYGSCIQEVDIKQYKKVSEVDNELLGKADYIGDLVKINKTDCD